jgi:hypothetical protein
MSPSFAEVQVEVSVSAVGNEFALEQFYRWLREDLDITRVATVSRTSTSGTGHMGALEVICMTLSTSTGLASLAMTYANWRRTRKDPPALKFSVSGPVTDELRKILDKLNQPEDEKPEDENGLT